MIEILDALVNLAIYCRTSECNKCQFSTHMGESFVRYECSLYKLAEELDTCPCYWDLDKIKEILNHD